MSKYKDNPCPKIRHTEDFKNWMKTIEEKSIQSWTTRDWLKMYEQIEDCIQNSYYHKGLVWEKYNARFKKNEISQEEFEKINIKIDNNQFLRNEFVSGCEEEFIKLYKNYRMEPEHYSAIIQKGKEIGRQLASRGNIDCSAVAFSLNARRDSMQEINVIMLNNAYDIDENELEQRLAKIEVTDKQRISSSGIKGIEIEGDIYDSSIKTMTHEGTHYYFQTTALWMRDLLEQGITAKAIPQDLAQFMRMNAVYYLDSKSKKDISNLDADERLRYQDEAFAGYRKQPVEKHANLMGTIIEHTYRSHISQYSERNSIKLYPYIEDTLGMPYKTTHNGKSVTFAHHKTPYLGIEQVIKSFKDMPEEIIEEMNIRENNESIAYDIPENWSANKKIEDFIAIKEKEYAEADSLQETVMYAIRQQKTKGR